MKTVLYLVIPCYNEDDTLPVSSKLLLDKMKELIEKETISENSKIMFVDDGSVDSTWKIIEECNKDDKLFSGLKLTKNCGQQNAMLAGISAASKFADAVITLDADLQDDINVFESMLAEYENGSDIVYGVRDSRKTDGAFKRNTALMFYKLMHLLGTDLVYNNAQFRLLSKKTIEVLEQYTEVRTYLPALLPTLGLKSSKVYYSRKKRVSGAAKFTYTKLFYVALDAISSFSARPIRLISLLAGLSCLAGIANLIAYFAGNSKDKWLTVCACVWFVGSMILVTARIIGEYILNILSESKKRPKYIVEQQLGNPE